MDDTVNNGDGEKLSTQSSIIRYRIDELARSQKDILGKIDKMNDRLVDPDAGIVVQVRNIKERTGKSTAKFTAITTSIEQLSTICAGHDRRLAELENHYETSSAKTAAGIDDLRTNFGAISSTLLKLNSDFEARRTTRKHLDRIIGLIILAILACLVPAVKNMIGVDGNSGDDVGAHETMAPQHEDVDLLDELRRADP